MIVSFLFKTTKLVTGVAKTTVRKSCNNIFNPITNLLKNNTKIGRGIQKAKIAVKNKTSKIFNEKETNIDDILVFCNKKKANLSKLSTDKEFLKTLQDYCKSRNISISSINNISDEKIIQNIIESSGVGPTKLAQIISNTPKYMLTIEKTMPNLAKAIKLTRSNCSFSRTIEEAQKVLDKSFPNQGFVIQKELSAGSVGATYLVKRPDGSVAVLKMLKKGITSKSMEAEEKLCSKLIDELSLSSKEAHKIKTKLSECYSDWKKELDFSLEYQNNKLLSTGAKRFKVAKITEISNDAKCIIMDKASGIQMDKLIKILKDYKTNPKEYFIKNANLIKEYPWLAKPEKVIQELPATLVKTFDEQFMFMKPGGKSIMHGDPHSGNIFISTDKKGRLITEFIDTGNCVVRSGKDIIDDVQFFSNYFVGNSEGVANYFVKRCGLQGEALQESTAKVAKDIQKYIFNSKQNVTNFNVVHKNIQYILKQNGLELTQGNATALKAQMQFFTNISEINALGSNSNKIISTVIKDIPQASWSMIKTGTNPFHMLKEAGSYFWYNKEASVSIAYQFKTKNVVKNIFSATDGKGGIVG